MDSFGDRRISIVIIIILCIGFFLYYDQTIKSESLELKKSRQLPKENKMPTIEELRKLPEIRVKVISGCANKLRSLKAWYIVSQYLKKPLMVEWDTKATYDGNSCLGTFEDVYTNLPDVTIVNKINGKIQYNGNLTAKDILENLEQQDKTKQLQFDRNMLCSAFIPQMDFQREVDTFVRNHSISNAHAIHIRRGDFKTKYKNQNYQWTDDKVKKRFNELVKENKQVFLLTDEKDVQEMAKTILKSNLIIYKPLKKQINGKATDRPTSFRDAYLEIYIAIQAKTFEGTIASSFSQTIRDLRECS